MAGSLNIRELITRLGFDIEEEKLKAFERNLSHVKTGLIAITGAAAGLAAGLLTVTKFAANAGDELDAQASLLGFSVEGLQRWTRAAEIGDLQAEEFAGSMSYLTRTIGDAVRGQGTAGKTFKELGIRLTDSSGRVRQTSEIMEDLAARFKDIPDPSRRASIAMDLFGRQGQRMGRFLADATEHMEKATRVVEAFGFFTEDTAKLADEANDAWANNLVLLRGLRNEIGIRALPMFKKLNEALTNWLINNKEIIKANIAKAVAALEGVLTKLLDVGLKVLEWLGSLIESFGGLGQVLKVFGAIAAGVFGGTLYASVASFINLIRILGNTFLIAWAKALIVPALIAAAIAAVILIIEDLYTWIKGGDSVIGDWLGSFEEFRDRVKDVWQDIKDIFQGALEFIRGVFTLDWKRAMKGLGMATGGLTEGLEDGLQVITGGRADAPGAAITQGGFNSMVGPGSPVAMMKDQQMPLVTAIGAWLRSKGFRQGAENFRAALQPSAPTPALAGIPAQIARPTAMAGSKTEYNISTKAEITVPPGTPEAQQEWFKEAMEKMVTDHWGRELRTVHQNNPRQE